MLNALIKVLDVDQVLLKRVHIGAFITNGHFDIKAIFPAIAGRDFIHGITILMA